MIRFSGTNMIKMVHTPYYWRVNAQTFIIYKSVRIEHMGWFAAVYFGLVVPIPFLSSVIDIANKNGHLHEDAIPMMVWPIGIACFSIYAARRWPVIYFRKFSTPRSTCCHAKLIKHAQYYNWSGGRRPAGHRTYLEIRDHNDHTLAKLNNIWDTPNLRELNKALCPSQKSN